MLVTGDLPLIRNREVTRGPKRASARVHTPSASLLVERATHVRLIRKERGSKGRLVRARINDRSVDGHFALPLRRGQAGIPM